MLFNCEDFHIMISQQWIQMNGRRPWHSSYGFFRLKVYSFAVQKDRDWTEMCRYGNDGLTLNIEWVQKSVEALAVGEAQFYLGYSLKC